MRASRKTEVRCLGDFLIGKRKTRAVSTTSGQTRALCFSHSKQRYSADVIAVIYFGKYIIVLTRGSSVKGYLVTFHLSRKHVSSGFLTGGHECVVQLWHDSTV